MGAPDGAAARPPRGRGARRSYWEFAYAGPALLDVGQILRWDPPRAFQDAFAAGYVAAGGALVDAALAPALERGGRVLDDR